MSFMDLFFSKKKGEQQKPAQIAEDRLKLVLARNKKTNVNFDVKAMENEIIEVVKKYIEESNVSINSETEGDMEALSIEVKF